MKPLPPLALKLVTEVVPVNAPLRRTLRVVVALTTPEPL